MISEINRNMEHYRIEAGTEKIENNKTFVWTIRVADSNISIGEWIEKVEYHFDLGYVDYCC